MSRRTNAYKPPTCRLTLELDCTLHAALMDIANDLSHERHTFVGMNQVIREWIDDARKRRDQRLKNTQAARSA